MYARARCGCSGLSYWQERWQFSQDGRARRTERVELLADRLNMQTFEARLRPCCFWGAALVLPAVFFAFVQVWSVNAGDAPPVAHIVLLVGVAQAMPVAALAWMLGSVAGYSIGAGRLVVHRVIFDREYVLDGECGGPQLSRGVITLAIQRHRFRLRVSDPAACLAALRAARRSDAVQE